MLRTLTAIGGFVLAGLLWPAGPAIAQAPPTLPLTVAPGVSVVRAAFGIISRSAAGDEKFVEATEVPAVEGQVFGWVVEIAGDPESVRWEEQLTLPRRPASWGGLEDDPDVVISPDGRSATTHGRETPEGGVLSRFVWALSAGDPPGDYLLEVAIEGKLVASVRFHVAVTVQGGSLVVLAARPRDPG
jgi:hypothetical protein